MEDRSAMCSVTDFPLISGPRYIAADHQRQFPNKRTLCSKFLRQVTGDNLDRIEWVPGREIWSTDLFGWWTSWPKASLSIIPWPQVRVIERGEAAKAVTGAPALTSVREKNKWLFVLHALVIHLPEGRGLWVYNLLGHIWATKSLLSMRWLLIIKSQSWVIRGYCCSSDSHWPPLAICQALTKNF